MLTSNEVQFLVGLLLQAAEKETVEVVVGERVWDSAAEKYRDVDITVSYKTHEGVLVAFKGIEVKDHTRPLSVEQLEGLCAKFIDMPAVSYRAIVSSSGYTKAAIRKAEKYGVELFHLQRGLPIKQTDWNLKVSSDLQIYIRSVSWHGTPQVQLTVSKIPQGISELQLDWKVYKADGTAIDHIHNLDELSRALAKIRLDAEAENIYSKLNDEDIVIVRLPLEVADKPLLEIGKNLVTVEAAMVTGYVKCRKKIKEPDFRVLVKHGDVSPFISCAITEGMNGELFGVTFKTEGYFGVIRISLEDRLKRKISHQVLGKLKITVKTLTGKSMLP